MEEVETYPHALRESAEVWYIQMVGLAMGEHPQGLLANIQKWDIDAFHYQRTADTGRLSVNINAL